MYWQSLCFMSPLTGPPALCGPPAVIPLPHPLLPIISLALGFCFQWVTATPSGVPMCLVHNFV